MFTRYFDLHPSTNVSKSSFLRMHKIQQMRDQDVREFFKKNRIGMFPKPLYEMELYKKEFEEFSRKRPLLGIFLCDIESQKCGRLHKGNWEIFSSLEEATRDWYKIAPEIVMTDHIISYFE